MVKTLGRYKVLMMPKLKATPLLNIDEPRLPGMRTGHQGLPDGSSFFFAPAPSLGDIKPMKTLSDKPNQPQPLAEICAPSRLMMWWGKTRCLAQMDI